MWSNFVFALVANGFLAVCDDGDVFGLLAFHLDVKCAVGDVQRHVLKRHVAAVVNGDAVVGGLYFEVAEGEAVGVVDSPYDFVCPYFAVFNQHPGAWNFWNGVDGEQPVG